MNISELSKFRGGVSVDTINELTSASGVTADGVLLKDAAVTATGGVTAPTISEAVSGSGVTVDGVLLKDSNVNASGVTAETVTATGNMVTDTILERTSAAGVTIDGVLLKDGGITATGTNTINLTTITADTINETTAGSGVTVDGVLLKDSTVSASGFFGTATPISLSNNAATTVYTIADEAGEAGKIEGTLKIVTSSGTNYTTWCGCAYSRQQNGTTYNVGGAFFCDDIPSGTLFSNSGSAIQITLPNVANFTSASFKPTRHT